MKPGVKPLLQSQHSRDTSGLKNAPDASLSGDHQARHFAYFTYLVFAAFARAATAVFESSCEFMNFVTTSEIAPAAASG
jgi:hypothetical protein